ncbi:MAG: biotin--[acetyl-CoA-carboxylase] ligase [Oscillospiraceae bacterium]|nr:biotin--[acetyl-CoA-carboxylase] ligase [Oscillospiraceae bacterium]
MLKKPKCGLIHQNGFLIYSYNEVTSTNDLLMQAGKEGAKSGTVVIAKTQTAGKGSKGRSFYSPPSGLYLSVLIRPGARENASTLDKVPPICPYLTVEETQLITPAVACAVASAIHYISGRKVGIKWVNDIYIGGKKVSGILTESGVDVNGERFYVIGIGVNMYPPEGGFPEEFARNTTTIFHNKQDPVIITITKNYILKSINKRLNQIRGRDFLYDYNRLSVILGNTVEVQPLNGDEPYLAEAVRIDRDARLVVRTSTGELRTLNSEEVKVSPRKHPEDGTTTIFDLTGRIASNKS